jgi:hypothetical protein
MKKQTLVKQFCDRTERAFSMALDASLKCKEQFEKTLEKVKREKRKRGN